MSSRLFAVALMALSACAAQAGISLPPPSGPAASEAPASPVPEPGVIVINATPPGKTALDCADDADCARGPVSEALQRTLTDASAPFPVFFDAFSRAVVEITKGRQTPSLFATASLSGPVIDPSPVRKAVVVANADYANLQGLKGPIGDGETMARLLRGLGFDVTLLKNVEPSALKAAVDTLGAAATGAGTAVVYYSGHGFSAEKHGYLPAMKASTASIPDLVASSMRVEDLVASMSTLKFSQRLLILDTHFPDIAASAR